MESFDYMVIVSAVVLGLSLLATAARFFDWFIHSEPATMVRTTRWMLLALLAACVGLLAVMIVRGHWTGAMLAGAGSLLLGSTLKWRAVLAPFARFRRNRNVFDMPIAPDDPETVRRAVAVLEAYVRQPARQMSAAEALEVLGLPPGADAEAIRAAHRRLMRLVHPEHAGTTWLAARVNEARDTLLGTEERLLPFRQSSGD